MFWVQWCLMYLTDGEALAPPNSVQMACCAEMILWQIQLVWRLKPAQVALR